MDIEIEKLNQQYLNPTAEKTKWACVLELAQLIPESQYQWLFHASQKAGWPIHIIRVLARVHGHS